MRHRFRPSDRPLSRPTSADDWSRVWTLPDSALVRQAPSNVAILIPAFRPTFGLEELVSRLVQAQVPAILLIDDGSPEEDRPVFERMAQYPCVHVLRHETNRGKGRALKTGIEYFLEHLSHYAGLVTADADGQHSPDDVLRVMRALHRTSDTVILGARNLRGRTIHHVGAPIPLRSRLGNRVILSLFRRLARLPLTDAQTGLRALPTHVLPQLLRLRGERYDFEMAVLFHLARTGQPLAEQPIRTLYDERNASSSFRPVRDSLLVLQALFRRAISMPAYPAGIADVPEASSADRSVRDPVRTK